MRNRKPLLLSLAIPAIFAPAYAFADAPTPAFVNFHNTYGLRAPMTAAEAANDNQAPANDNEEAPAPAGKPAKAGEFVEREPEASSEEAMGANAKTPKFVRINIDNYHIRTTPDFETKDTKNVAGKSSKNAIYAVTRIQKTQTGTAVGIWVNGKEHWIFAPNWRKDQFSFCESEACFADLATVLKILSRQGVTNQSLAECGISLDNRGNPVVAELPSKPGQIPMPPPRKAADLKRRDSDVASTRGELSHPLPWEKAKGAAGKQWSKWVLESLNKYGKNLINQRSLGDAAAFCPNYSKLTPSQRTEMWAHLVASVAIPESGFVTNKTYNEVTGLNDKSGPIKPHDHSQGLLALSYGSSSQRAYKNFCKFDYAADRGKDLRDQSLSIYNVQKQLDCGVGILDYWVKRDGRIGGSPPRGGARFWSTLRNTNKATLRVKKSMRDYGPCFGR